jgi:hypothetical protein
VHYCSIFQTTLACVFAAAISATAALFYFRLRAVFVKHRAICVLFSLLWLAVFAGCVLIPFSILGDRIGPTDRCTISKALPYGSVGMIANTIYDTLVFLAISWHLVFRDKVLESRVKAFLCGQGLFELSKVMVQGQNAYYL